jgi:hypothetical protein
LQTCEAAFFFTVHITLTETVIEFQVLLCIFAT